MDKSILYYFIYSGRFILRVHVGLLRRHIPMSFRFKQITYLFSFLFISSFVSSFLSFYILHYITLFEFYSTVYFFFSFSIIYFSGVFHFFFFSFLFLDCILYTIHDKARFSVIFIRVFIRLFCICVCP